MRSRRQFLSAAAGLGLATAGCVDALGGKSRPPTGPAVAFEPVAGGFTSPLGLEAPGTDRLYVVDQAGTVELVEGGSVRESPFLDVTDRMVQLGGYEERGLLGLAFHPEFPDDGRCFVRYSAPRREDTPSGYDHTFVLSEFEATPQGADPDSERVLLEIPQPQSNHNAGSVVFGPDGYLYVGVGDGGGGGDRGTGHVEDWYDAVAGGNGQDLTENLLGSVLRIDVDGRADGKPYAVPEDNPLVGSEGLDEQYAWGFRNPWRMSFDGDRLLVADVGQDEYEEVDLVRKGGNYGWNVREATHCYGAGDCPDRTPDGDPLRDPVVEYAHDLGISVIGGYVYRGEEIPTLQGKYVFGDWQGSGGDPTLFLATPREEGLWPMERLELSGETTPGAHLLSMGEGPDGALYVCTSERQTVAGSTGAVHRIRPPVRATRTTRDTRGSPMPTNTTDGGSAPSSTTNREERATTAGPDQPSPGFEALAALVGIGGALAYLRRR